MDEGFKAGRQFSLSAEEALSYGIVAKIRPGAGPVPEAVTDEELQTLAEKDQRVAAYFAPVKQTEEVDPAAPVKAERDPATEENPAPVEEGKAEEMIAMLYDRFSKYPELMPGLYVKLARTFSPEIAACDFVAGMTDRYAVRTFENIFIPKGWNT